MLNFSNWEIMLKTEFEVNGDDYSKKTCTLTDEDLKTPFYNGSAGSMGEPFMAWGEKYVYFPVRSDGVVIVASVPRNPPNE
jgi:hypothetical protein